MTAVSVRAGVLCEAACQAPSCLVNVKCGFQAERRTMIMVRPRAVTGQDACFKLFGERVHVGWRSLLAVGPCFNAACGCLGKGSGMSVEKVHDARRDGATRMRLQGRATLEMKVSFKTPREDGVDVRVCL